MLRRFAAVVLFVALVLATAVAGTLSAQGRGGFRGGPAGGRMGSVTASAPRPAFVLRTPPVVAPRFGGARIGGLRHQRTVIVADPFFGYSPFFGGYSPFWGEPYYPQPAYSEPTYGAPPVSQNDIDLSYQVQRLSQEIEQLRQEQALTASRQYVPAPPSAPGPPPTPTTLVFRDGHRMMVENYAIVGQTIWILDEKTSVKISMSELDLEATERENRSKGVRFLLPQR
jgi:hypothetical protein